MAAVEMSMPLSKKIGSILRLESSRLMQQERLEPGRFQERALNLHAEYRPSFTDNEAVKEHTSNWADQINAQARLLNQHGIEGNVLFTREPSPDGGLPTIVAKFGPGHFLLGTIKRDKWKGIEFRNRESVILPASLELGATSKARLPDSIGAHGEGFKVGVNRLLRSGYNVTYHTHGEDWKFEHRDQSLCVTRSRLENTKSKKFYDTVITISHDNQDTLLLWEEKTFLCLTEWYTVRAERANYMFALSGDNDLSVEVLLDPQHHGNLYANGVFISRYHPSYTGKFGFNFRGKAMTPGRDRNSLTRSQLLHAFTSVLNRLARLVRPDVDRVLNLLAEGSLFHDVIKTSLARQAPWVSFFVKHVRQQKWYPCKTERDARNIRRWFKEEARVVTDNQALLFIHADGFLPAQKERNRRFGKLPQCNEADVVNLRKPVTQATAVIVEKELPVHFVRVNWNLGVVIFKAQGIYINLHFFEQAKQTSDDSMMTLIFRCMLWQWADPSDTDYAEVERKRALLNDIRYQFEMRQPQVPELLELESANNPKKRKVPSAEPAAKRQVRLRDLGDADEGCAGSCPLHCQH